MTLRDDILVAKNNRFLSLEIEGDSKKVINCFNNIINPLFYYDINGTYLKAI